MKPSDDPRYQQAVRQERIVWDTAFLPVTEDICGIEVLPMTPIHHMSLRVANSPFVCGGEIGPAAVLNFLWCISPKYNTSRLWRVLFFRSLRLRWNRTRETLDDIILGIYGYMDEVWQDCPPKPLNGKGSVKDHYSLAVEYCHKLCPKYGTVNDVLNMPYKQIFQLLKPMMHQEWGVPLFAPSDSVRASLRAESNSKLAKDKKP